MLLPALQLTMEGTETEVSDHTETDDDCETGLPQGRLLALNSRRLIATHLRQIADALGLPTSGSVDQVRQLIEGKLQETRGVSNVQVVVTEATYVP